MPASNGAINLISDGFAHLKNYYGRMFSEIGAGYRTGNYALPIANQEARDAFMAHYDMASQNKMQMPGAGTVGLKDISYKRLAGVGLAGFAAMNIPYRLATGGSLYRDSNGNSNIIGVPLI